MDTKQIKMDVLKTIENELKQADIATIYVEADGENIASDVLTALLPEIGADADEVSVEMTFLPDEGNDKLLYFVSAFNFAEDIDEAYMLDLCIAIAKINYYLPAGAFACENGTLVLKLNTTLPVDISVEKIRETCSALVASGISLTNLFVRPLLRLSEGRMSLEDALEGLIY